MHLHARRIRIDHPDGSPLDIRAELPTHFAETLANLGFDIELGDLPLDEDLPKAPRREVEKKQAMAHAKQVRKERRGERRSRSGGRDGKPGARDGKPAARDGGKPAGKSGSRTGKPGGRAAPSSGRGPLPGTRSSPPP